ncbi:GtrA family protein [Clostridium sp. NSJ-145]|uniref:GtrA family protein n=1 Tax=Clostridium sp. NSJ-145 TaxID=2897777 RepID=UPI001E4148C0|nr:GtrA family protein [Clostridium sp. NSJ-145]MCD2502370.1 GtrA family protein [Clostridium sp. NSJ-145]
MNYINSNFIREFLRFVIVGIIATAISYGVYIAFEKLGLQYNIAYTLGYIISFCFNYVASTYFTFKTKANVKKGAKFTCAHIFNYCLQMILLNIFIYIGIGKGIAPIFVYAISIPVNFIIVRIALKDKK